MGQVMPACRFVPHSHGATCRALDSEYAVAIMRSEHQRARWVGISRIADNGEWVSLTIFDHPDNPRATPHTGAILPLPGFSYINPVPGAGRTIRPVAWRIVPRPLPRACRG